MKVTISSNPDRTIVPQIFQINDFQAEQVVGSCDTTVMYIETPQTVNDRIGVEKSGLLTFGGRMGPASKKKIVRYL